jgi:signal transduction histidine kinase
MSASIAHEFSSPIYGIRNVLELIEKKVRMNGENKEFIDIAMRECNRMTDFIKRLQGFYSPTSNIVKTTNIHKVVEEMILMIQKKMSAGSIELEKDYDSHMPEIEVVPDQIKQVVLNLLNNAIEATPESGGKIKIRTEVLKTRIKIHIEDSGCGINPENMERIFEPFFTSKQEGGTGLGLYISYGIIKRHGGELKVKSKPDAGTTFTIMLPMKGVKV